MIYIDKYVTLRIFSTFPSLASFSLLCCVYISVKYFMRLFDLLVFVLLHCLFLRHYTCLDDNDKIFDTKKNLEQQKETIISEFQILNRLSKSLFAF